MTVLRNPYLRWKRRDRHHLLLRHVVRVIRLRVSLGVLRPLGCGQARLVCFELLEQNGCIGTVQLAFQRLLSQSTRVDGAA